MSLNYIYSFCRLKCVHLVYILGCSGNNTRIKMMKTPEHSSHEEEYLGRYIEERTLSKNIKDQTGNGPYTCAICLTPFTAACTLKSHMMTHTGEKPYKCDTCLKQFTAQSALKSHMVIHTGGEPYKCKICFKQFTQVAPLKSHRMTHTGEKAYKCDICLK
uniref:Zinc finger protein 486-like n=1 Tax=Diabrotica virgifera virgifera TaxID=50390 RepID=A0A6P7H4H7_DIAVI